MRTPGVRFPFIIPFHQKKRELKEMNAGTEDNVSLVLKKMVFLESALDELLEREPPEKGEMTTALPEHKLLDMEPFFKGLITIMDGLDGAGRLAAESGKSELNRGIEIFDRKLLCYLASWEFVQSTDVGMKFDPCYHEAVGIGPSSSPVPGLVADIIEKGWTFRGKVLRFAKVIVTK